MHHLYLLAWLGLFCASFAHGAASATPTNTPFDCATEHCGVFSDLAFPHLVVGTVAGIATPEQATAIFAHQRAQGHWQALPDDAALLPQAIQLVSLRAAGQLVTVAISREEYLAAPFKPGDFVRYAPHRGREKPDLTRPNAMAWWNQIGCIPVLCSSALAGCAGKYIPGFYDTTGKQISMPSASVVNGGVQIDTQTFFPLNSKPAD